MADYKSRYSTQFVTDSLFGVNSILRDNHFAEGGPFQDAISLLRPSNIRYPGGTVTEYLLDPETALFQEIFEDDQNDFLQIDGFPTVNTVQSFFRYAEAENFDVTFVLPTLPLLKEGKVGERFVEYPSVVGLLEKVEGLITGRYGDITISAFEIGNEYFVNNKMSSVEYGRVANALITGVHDLYDRLEARGIEFQRPDLLIQAAPGWFKNGNTEIRSAMSGLSESRVDGVIGHFYPNHYDSIPNFGNFFKSLNDWERFSSSSDFQIYMTEWNMNAKTGSEFGVGQAAGMISMFHEMVTQGVDFAHAWPAQHHNVKTSLTHLTGFNNSIDPADREFATELSVPGALFSLMKEILPGQYAVDLDESDIILGRADDQINVRTFANDETVTLLVSSRAPVSQRIDLDLGQFFGPIYESKVSRLYAIDDPTTSNIDESDPFTSKARAALRVEAENYLDSPRGDLFLPSGEIVIIQLAKWGSKSFSEQPIKYFEVIGTSDNDLILEQTEPSRIFGLEGDDLIFASAMGDMVFGGSGADILMGSQIRDYFYGGAGADRLVGNEGNDWLDGGDGDDFIYGGLGDDDIRGGSGNDVIYSGDGIDYTSSEGSFDVFGRSGGRDRSFGGAGDDRIFGGNGADELEGGGGDDRVFGGHGGDLLFGNGGKDALYGGDGSDLMYGQNGDDFLFGGSADDSMYGDTGNDLIEGGAGQDTMVGGSGSDLFIFRGKEDSSSESPDYIHDFSAEDRIFLAQDPYLNPENSTNFVFSGNGPVNHGIWVEQGRWSSRVNVDYDGDAIGDLVFETNSFDFSAHMFLF